MYDVVEMSTLSSYVAQWAYKLFSDDELKKTATRIRAAVSQLCC